MKARLILEDSIIPFPGYELMGTNKIVPCWKVVIVCKVQLAIIEFLIKLAPCGGGHHRL